MVKTTRGSVQRIISWSEDLEGFPCEFDAHSPLGKRVHWIRDHHGPAIGRWRKLGTSERTESRVVGFVGDYALGLFLGF